MVTKVTRVNAGDVDSDDDVADAGRISGGDEADGAGGDGFGGDEEDDYGYENHVDDSDDDENSEEELDFLVLIISFRVFSVRALGYSVNILVSRPRL